AVLDADGKDITDIEHIGNLNPFRYRGYYYDVETGLYFLQTRYYDPETGRFISQDSVEYAEPETVNGINLYAYCGNNPVMNIDPTGTSFFLVCLLVGLVVGAVAGATISGVNASNNGATGWELFGAILGGAILGGAIGAFSGAIIGIGGTMIGSGLGMVGGFSGLATALAGGGTIAAGAAAGIGSMALGGAVVIGGVAVAGLGVQVLMAKGSGPRMGHNQYEKQMWKEAMRQLKIEDKDLIRRLHELNEKKPYADSLKRLLDNLREILSSIKGN
ncbi:MAG: RHS repeat-associated core domain-containing protein, partial [Clostridia bacterium]|nr:RHS repeat-associated core domain-containing protein [Clostridia bacterium]